MDTDHPIFKNDVILRHLFGVVPYGCLKKYRLVCRQWRKAADSEFKYQSTMTIKFGGEETQMEQYYRLFSIDKPPRKEFEQNVENILDSFQEMEDYGTDVLFENFKLCGKLPWTDANFRQFVKYIGKQAKCLKVDLQYGWISTPADLIHMENAIFEFMPNLKELNIKWGSEIFASDKINEYRKLYNSPSVFPERKPKSMEFLKSVTVHIMENNLYEKKFADVRDILNQIFEDLMACTSNLIFLAISDNIRLDLAVEQPFQVSNITKIVIWKKKKQYNEMDALVALSEQGLRLKEFIIFYLECENNLLNFPSLVRFLETQKNCLEKYKIHWERTGGGYMSDYTLHENFLPPFPKMEKLESLEIKVNVRGGSDVLYFQESNWISKFPSLKSLSYATDIDCSVVEDVDPFATFLGDKSPSNTCNTVTYVFVSACEWSQTRRMGMESAVKYFKKAQKRFPNLARLELFSVLENGSSLDYYVNSYGGSMDNSYTLEID